MKDVAALRLPVGIAAAVGLGLLAPAAQADDYTVENTADAGTGSLRDVIGTTNTHPGADRILFNSGLSGEILLESDLPPIEGPIEIAGPGPAQLAIDGNKEHRPFAIHSDATISGLTLRNARSPRQCQYFDAGSSCSVQPGGAIRGYKDADLVVYGMVFRDNDAQESGGGAISTLADLSIGNSAFERNSSDREGGAVEASADFNDPPGDLRITNSVFIDNETLFEGGGAVAKRAWHALRTVAISGSTFSGNTSGGDGGALLVTNYGPVNLTDSTFTGNTAKGRGGGMYLGFWSGGAGPSSVSGSLFDDNQANGDWSTDEGGGGLAIGQTLGDLSLDNSTFTANGTSGRGSAVQVQGGTVDIDSITAVGNTGGGALFKEHGESTLRNSIVSGNSGGDLSGDPYYRGPDFPFPGTDFLPTIEPAGTWKTSFSLIGTTNATALVDDQPGSNIIGDTSPQLGGLTDNGGLTQTMLPAATSPAVNQGSTDLLKDQRGLTRPVDLETGAAIPAIPGADGSDIGAVELRPADLIVPIHGAGPTGTLRFGKVTLNKKKGFATLPVRVPAAGAVRLVGSKKLVGRKAGVKAAGKVKLKIRARGKTLKALRRRGKARVKVVVNFTSAAGNKISKGTTVKLIKKKRKKKKK